MKITIKGSEIQSKEEFHQQLKAKLNLPEYYGGNLDALGDCLTGWVKPPITIEWLEFNESEKKLGEYTHKALELFKKAEKEVSGFKIIYYP